MYLYSNKIREKTSEQVEKLSDYDIFIQIHDEFILIYNNIHNVWSTWDVNIVYSLYTKQDA